MPGPTDLVAALWRGVQVLRVVSAVFAVGAIIAHADGFARPGLGWAVLVGITVWTPLICCAYNYPATRNLPVIGADLLVTLGLMACSVPVLSAEQLSQSAERTPLLTTIWASGPVVAAAVHAGWVAGMSCGCAVAAMNVAVRGFVNTDMVRDSVLLIGVGLVLGLASNAARHITVRLRAAAQVEAANAERERLARAIHDSVLQVLAMVRARGNGLGGEAAELVRLAGEQEIALRALLCAPPPNLPATLPARNLSDPQHDLAAALRSLGGPRVEVVLPATPVPLPADDVAELVAATREALTNAARHGGPNVNTWVLVEDLGTEVVLTIRDDGLGMTSGQLATAAAAGRMGVSCSIRGRLARLGAAVRLRTEPERGTEWEVRLTRVRREPMC